MDTKLNGFVQLNYAQDQARTPGNVVIARHQFTYYLQFGLSRRVSQVAVNGALGQDIDFDNSRQGRGQTFNASATLNPTQHVELALVETVQSLNVHDPAGELKRLFTARVSRLRATYTFTARTFVRVIGQYVSTDSDPLLYPSARDGSFRDVQRLGALRLQTELAVRDVRRVRRRPRAVRRASAAPVRPPGVRQDLLRVPAMSPGSAGEAGSGAAVVRAPPVSGAGDPVWAIPPGMR